MPNQDITLRSEEVQEILTKIPHWMIRWGNVVILIILFLIISMSYVIEYPDVITTDVIITTANPPEKLMARSTGRIEKILVSNQQIIGRYTPLAVIENTANYKDVFRLKAFTDSLDTRNANFLFPFELFKNTKLGDIAGALSVFEKEYLAYRLNKDLHPFQVEGNAQSYEVVQLKDRLQLFIEQRDIAESELKIKKKELARFEHLYNKGVIAGQEWDTKNLEYLEYEKSVRNLNSSISQTKSSLNDLDKNVRTTKINDTKDRVNSYSNTLQSYNLLKKAIADWDLAYVLRSTIAGQVTYLAVWKENQSVNQGDNIFTVIASDDSYYVGKIKAAATNSGKIKKGQKVNIRLANYPDNEFGILNGVVNEISLIPDKDGYILIDVSLPKKLITSYNKPIIFRQEMMGTADIITEDLNLLERILHQFRDIFSRGRKDTNEAKKESETEKKS